MCDAVFTFIGWCMALAFALVLGLIAGCFKHNWLYSFFVFMGGLIVGWFLFVRQGRHDGK